MVQINYDALPNRSIIAIDCKSFFASVEAVKRGFHPLYAYIIVMSGADRDSGLVLAASPLVKKEYGIKTGSRRFEVPNDPKLIIVKPRMSLYLKVNGLIVDILRQYVADEDLLIYSIDEILIDVTDYKKVFGDVETIARSIQKEIWNKLKIATSVGIGPNPLMAKLCMDNDAKKSPESFARWTYEDVSTKLHSISPMTEFWGIGKQTVKRLKRLGIYSIRELAHSDLKSLKKEFGIIGEELYYHAWGVDYSIFKERYDKKAAPKKPPERSFGASQILPRDYKKQQEIEIIVQEMAEKISSRLRKSEVVCGGVSLSIVFSKHEDKKGFSHQMKIPYTNSRKKIKAYALELFRKYWHHEEVRQVAISCRGLVAENAIQLNLFDSPAQIEKERALDKVIDQAKERYGFKALMPAITLLESGTALSRSEFVGGHQGE